MALDTLSIAITSWTPAVEPELFLLGGGIVMTPILLKDFR